MATDNKTPGKIVSPQQGPAKIESKLVTVHGSFVKPQMPGTEAAVERTLFESNTDGTTLNTEKETMGELAGKLEEAQSQNQEWVETSVVNMCKLRPKKDWEAQGYFCHKGVKICHFGESEKIEDRESKTPHDRMHPDSQVKVISGAV